MRDQIALPSTSAWSDLHQSLPLAQEFTAMKHPMVIDECLISCFKYWDGSVKQGMRYNQELYGLLQTYEADERLQAYTVAYNQAEQGNLICITVSKTSYRLWLGLRSPEPTSSLCGCPSVQVDGSIKQ